MRPAEAVSGTSGQLRELRAWQAARLTSTYGDLLHDPECVDAVKFFLTDLYGPEEHSRRDQDLARAWSILSRTLPRATLGLLERAIELQTLTAQLDEAMVQQLATGPVTQESYAAAYRAVGRPEARRRQIDLVLTIATDLERVVRHAWVGLALRAARVPAHAAGYGALQDFLERGFAAFRRMKDAGRMLSAIRERETRLSAALLAGGPAPSAVQAGSAAPP
jgi:hypothetical protein